MKTINIYGVTRISEERLLGRFERHQSGRNYQLKIKEWEVTGLRQLAEALCRSAEDYDKLSFFYSFQIPKLGKEFDLLQVTEERIVNIELKSEPVPDEKIRKQLLLNKHYLAALEKDLYLFTYISSENRLVRLAGSERLCEASFEEVKEVLSPRAECITDDIEGLFREEQYLISPLEEPDRFLRRDYFLTSQQRDIKGKLLAGLEQGKLFQGFCGLPGTGKSLLLFDLGLQLSAKQRVAVLHFGSFPEEWNKLQSLLKRIDFFHCGTMEQNEESLPERLAEYSYLCVDEGHRMPAAYLEKLAAFVKVHRIPLIVSYDLEEAVAAEEREHKTAEILASLEGYVGYRLTNRIRTNAQLSNFIQNVVNPGKGNRKGPFPDVEILYAGSDEERDWMLEGLAKRGFRYLALQNGSEECGEFERVAMFLDERFFYDEKGYLRENCRGEKRYLVSRLFHDLNRAKKAIALIVLQNPEVFEVLLQSLQGRDDKQSK